MGRKSRCTQGGEVVPARLLHNEHVGVAGLLKKKNITLKVVCVKDDALVRTGKDIQTSDQCGNFGEYKVGVGINLRLVLQPECLCFCSFD